jgi:hypothetical protein
MQVHRVSGFGGFATRPTPKKDPLLRGGKYLRHGPKHTRETRQSRHRNEKHHL